MRVALAVWDGRISPVFDVAQQLALYEVEGDSARGPVEAALTAVDPAARAAEVSNLGVETLVCGAVSRPLAMMLSARGIQVMPFTAGDTEEVLQAFVEQRLPDPRLCMPGCGRRLAGMGPRGGGGPGRGRGRGGRGRGGSGSGRGGWQY